MGDLHHVALNDLEGFRDESKRLESFANWPRSAGAQPAALSRAGFYYTGERQKAACAFCHVVIEDWTFADQAIAKHRERSPNCPFVLQAYNNACLEPPTLTSSSLLWESERRKTFEGWPISFISPEDLARTGFVYLKYDDRVQCVFCHGIVGAWEEGDVPCVEHQRHFKSCSFVLRRSSAGNVSIEDEYRDHRATQHLASSGSTRSGYDVAGNRTVVPGFRPERSGVSAAAMVTASRTKAGLTNSELNILPHSPAKSPNFKNKEVRLRTFANWPTCVQQDPVDLAEAGFFYTGLSDHVKCFHCNGGLRNWEPKDIPWEEHARWFPNCEYISLNKGKEFINAANNHRPTSFLSFPSFPGVAASSVVVNRTSAREASEVSEAEIDQLMLSDVARQALDLNFEAHHIRQAMRRRMSHAGYPFADAESLANAVLDLEKVNSHEGESGVRRSVSLVELPISRNTDMSNPIPASRSGSLTKRSATDMDVDPKVCKICWDKDMCVVFLPCGHLVSCAECSSALKDCPFCRQEIKGTVRTYWP